MPIKFRQGNNLNPLVHVFLRHKRTINKIYKKNRTRVAALVTGGVRTVNLDNAVSPGGYTTYARSQTLTNGSITPVDNNFGRIDYYQSSYNIVAQRNHIFVRYKKSALNGKTISNIIVNGDSHAIGALSEITTQNEGGSTTEVYVQGLSAASVESSITNANQFTIDLEFTDTAKLYEEEDLYQLVWENINPPGIDFITADTLSINLDSRPTGNIRLSYASEGTRNLLSTGSTNIPILNRITTESSKDFDIPSALYFDAWTDQTNIWSISGNAAKSFNPKKTGTDKTDTATDIDLTSIVGSTPGGWRGGVYLNGYHWIINVSSTNFVAFCLNSSRVQLAARNIILPRAGYERAFGFGNTIWFINNVTNTADAYDVSGTSRPTADSTQDFSLGSGTWYGGDVSEKGVYFLDATGNAPSLHSYTKQDRQRRTERDYGLSTAGSPFPAYRGLVNFDSSFYALDTEQNKFKALQFFEKQNMNSIRILQRDVSLGAGDWRGGGGNQNTIWFLDNSGSTDKYLRAYTKGVLLTRDSSKDHNLGAGNFIGVCSFGNLMWVLRTDINELRALTISSTGILIRNVGQDITSLPSGFEGCVTDGNDIWLINPTTRTAVSYSVSSKTTSSKNIGLGTGAWQSGAIYSGAYLYFVNRNAVPPTTRVHLASDRSHQSSKQFNLFNPNRAAYRGALSVGKESWFIDDFNNMAYCYYVDIDVGSARIPQPYRTTSYRVVSLNSSGSSHQDVTISATQSPTVSNLAVRFVSDRSALPTAGTIYISGRVHGYPRPEITIDQGWTYPHGLSHISSRHFTEIGGLQNVWSFETSHHFSSNPGRTFRVTVTNSSGSSFGDVVFS